MSHIFGRSRPHGPEGWFQDLLWQEQSGEKFLDCVRDDRKSILVRDSFSMCITDLLKSTLF